MSVIDVFNLKKNRPKKSNKLEKLQIPVLINEEEALVLELNSECRHCPKKASDAYTKQWGGESFANNYAMLTREELLRALLVQTDDLLNKLAQTVECIGCRRSVETMYCYVKRSQNNFMTPLMINTNGVVSFQLKTSLVPQDLSDLFLEHSCTTDDIVRNIKTSRKSGRCNLHSMEGLKGKPKPPTWAHMWNYLDAEYKKILTTVNVDDLFHTLNEYLDKYRFCYDCKHKVHKAYNILVGVESTDGCKDKTFVPALFEKIKRCDSTHLQVCEDLPYLLTLIEKCKPDLQGRRERHAKTLEVAQEEVLTCLGLYLHDRIHGLATRIREEEQCYEILFHLGLDCLRRSIEVAFDKKRGCALFDTVCEEISKSEHTKKTSNPKKKKKKQKKKTECNAKKYESPCEDHPTTRSPCSSDNEIEHGVSTKNSFAGLCDSKSEGYHEKDWIDSPQSLDKSACLEHIAPCSSNECAKDGGYFSAQCSGGSSREPSDVACEEGFCSHSDDSEMLDHFVDDTHVDKKAPYTPLSAMLLKGDGADEEISEEEIRKFREEVGDVSEQRKSLREHLVRQFANLCSQYKDD